LKKDKEAATKDAASEGAVIDKVKATITEIVDPKKAEPALPKSIKDEKKDAVKKFMKKADEEAEREAQRKEELEADAPKPNPAVASAKETETAEGDKMSETIKEQVGSNNKALKAAVKKQETWAATAKAKSNQSSSKSSGEGGHSDDEIWTANMPLPEAGFIAKKMQTVVKK